MAEPSTFETIRGWLHAHPGLFGMEESDGNLVLFELAHQKLITLEPGHLERVEERPNAQFPSQSYLILLFENGKQLVLCDQGFAFPPDTTNTGPLEIPTAVFCLRDFHHMVSQLLQLEPERRKEMVDIVMILIALLDGARGVGLEVGKEEREVEGYLKRIEAGLPLVGLIA